MVSFSCLLKAAYVDTSFPMHRASWRCLVAIYCYCSFVLLLIVQLDEQNSFFRSFEADQVFLFCFEHLADFFNEALA